MAKAASKTTPSSRMEAAWQLFDGGDKVAARREAQKILDSSPSPEEAFEAKDLISRLGLPPLGLAFALAVAACIVALLLLARTYPTP